MKGCDSYFYELSSYRYLILHYFKYINIGVLMHPAVHKQIELAVGCCTLGNLCIKVHGEHVSK